MATIHTNKHINIVVHSLPKKLKIYLCIKEFVARCFNYNYVLISTVIYLNIYTLKVTRYFKCLKYQSRKYITICLH